MWLLIALIAVLAWVLVGSPILARRDKNIYVSSLFSLRSLPAGDDLVLDAESSLTRAYSTKDTEIAYEIYTTAMAEDTVRTNFTSKSDFIDYVATFDSTLTDTLRAREVDPTEYDIDRSAWEDEEKDDEDEENWAVNPIL